MVEPEASFDAVPVVGVTEVPAVKFSAVARIISVHHRVETFETVEVGVKLTGYLS